MEEVFIIIFSMVIGGLIGVLIGRNRKIGAGWSFVLGAFLGIIGWIIAAVSDKKEPEFTDMSDKSK